MLSTSALGMDWIYRRRNPRVSAKSVLKTWQGSRILIKKEKSFLEILRKKSQEKDCSIKQGDIYSWYSNFDPSLRERNKLWIKMAEEGLLSRLNVAIVGGAGHFFDFLRYFEKLLEQPGTRIQVQAFAQGEWRTKWRPGIHSEKNREYWLRKIKKELQKENPGSDYFMAEDENSKF